MNKFDKALQELLRNATYEDLIIMLAVSRYRLMFGKTGIALTPKRCK
jgi:hypothetical protein